MPISSSALCCFSKSQYFQHTDCAVKAFLILLSVLCYCCVAKRYRHRLRDEVVNEHYLVEEVYDRELRLAEEYEREKRAEMRALYGCPAERRTNYGSTGACSEQSTED